MSREIKFRAWDKEDVLYLHITKNKEDGVVGISPDGKKVLYLEDGEVITLKDVIIEQDTGLEDKNGKKIYEGDIVNVIGIGIAQVIDSPSGEWMLFYRREPDEINSGFVSVVPKNKPSGLWKTNTTSYIEVIGNIHENPELLKGEK